MGGREIEYALIMPKEVRVKFAPTLYFLLKVVLPWYEDITIVLSELSMAGNDHLSCSRGVGKICDLFQECGDVGSVVDVDDTVVIDCQSVVGGEFYNGPSEACPKARICGVQNGNGKKSDAVGRI